MSEEVKAAEERLRRMGSEPKARATQEICDAFTLAYAYLSEHPADSDEAIDEAWLRSVGFKPFDDLGSGFVIHCPDVELSMGYRGQWLIEGTELIEHPPETRGDLRLLCRALGIELKEPSNV